MCKQYSVSIVTIYLSSCTCANKYCETLTVIIYLTAYTNIMFCLKVYGYLGKGRKSNAGRKRKTGPKKRARQVAEDSEMEETVVHLDDGEEQQYLDGSLNRHLN